MTLPNIRIVGGPLDGETYRISGGEKDGTSFALRSTGMANLSDGPIPMGDETVEIVYYSIRTITGWDDFRLTFLAPTKWTFQQTIEHQFNKA